MTYLLHQLLKNAARRFPDGPAVVDGGQTVTYRELDERSNQIARLLREMGIGKDHRVGVCVDKSAAMIAAVFGVLKAGAAYVPLDPLAPAKRIGFIVRDCALSAVCVSGNRLARLKECAKAGEEIAAIVVDGSGAAPEGVRPILADAISRQSGSAPPEADITENDLAYILYTSGSTGTPKGVMISHRASLTFVDWSHDCFELSSRDRVAGYTPLHFDLSILDIFSTVKAGGAIVLVPPELSLFPAGLADFIEAQSISVWYSVPSILTQLVLRGELSRHPYAQLRAILFAGEVFPVKYLRQLMELIPRARYYNLYGPTETNVCTYHEVPGGSAELGDLLPIGRACANTEVFAIDSNGALVQPGGTGELFVRGPSLTKGYWGQRTSEYTGLCPHPLSPLVPEQVYRTGDLVTLHPNGDYTWMGRISETIKSRGYRIEPGEVTARLLEHPAVKEACTFGVPHPMLGSEIKSVVVKAADRDVKADELRVHCAEFLPSYMIPSIIEFRSELPRTSTGKIDRTALERGE
ncbi:amino acid adenylation domain-containing protein [Sorangium sp. So ce429]